jgi:hypothetical protein
MTHTAYNAAQNSPEVDRALAAELRITIAETYWSMPVSLSTDGLVGMFLSNAFTTDDSTLVELEALYHASRNAGEFTWDDADFMEGSAVVYSGSDTVRSTYTEAYWSLVDGTLLSNAGLVGMFLSNASLADDYTLAELDDNYWRSLNTGETEEDDDV